MDKQAKIVKNYNSSKQNIKTEDDWKNFKAFELSLFSKATMPEK